MPGRNLFANEAAPKGRNLFAGEDVSEPVQQQQEPSGFPGASIIEPAATVASAIPAEILGGLSTLLPVVMGDPDKAEANLKAMRELITFEPRTEAGKEGLQSFGEAVNKKIPGIDKSVPEMLQNTEDAFSKSGAQTFDTLGLDPAIGAGAGAVIPEAIASALGFKLAKSASKAPAIKKVTTAINDLPLDAEAAVKNLPQTVSNVAKKTGDVFTKQSKFKQGIAKQIESGGTDSVLAKYIVNGAGKVKKDKIAIESIKQGFDKGVVAAVKGSSPSDKAKMLKMVNVMQRTKENALEGVKIRPSDIAGQSLARRINYVKNLNKQAGSKLDSVAKSLKGKTVDFSQPVNSFIKKLDDMGIKIDEDFNPVFNNSSIDGVDAAQAVIKRSIKRLRSGGRNGTPDAYDLHILKKFIDENVTFGKAGEGLKGKTKGILKELRHDIDTVLDSNFKKYDTVNTRYAETINSLNLLKDEAGKKIDIFGANADKSTGVLLRGLMSNNKGRIALMEAVESLDSTAKKYGAKFDDNISMQMLFADELDSVFGPAARTSLSGEVGKAVKGGAEVAVGQKTIPGVVLEASGAVVDKMQGVNEAGAFKSIKDLLNR